MRKLYSILFLTLLLTGCEKKTKKENCESRIVSETFLKKYLIVKDSCSLYEGSSSIKYYDNNKILMSGYNNRLLKQGLWSFYYPNQKDSVKGIFKDTEPQGVWNFRKIGDLSWEVFNNSKYKYRISFPKGWVIYETDQQNTIEILDTENRENFNLKIIVNSIFLDEADVTIDDIYKPHLDLLKKDGDVSGIRHKELNISNVDKGFEINYFSSNDSLKYFSRELIFEFNSAVYVVSSITKEEQVYDYTILEEIITTSFRLSSD